MRLKTRRTAIAASVLVFVFSGVLPSLGQDPSASLTIRFANGASQFHVGELIPIELAFSASVADTYEISTRSYDRSGRLDLEQFRVSPSGRDPLRNHYNECVFVSIGGGIGGTVYLTGEPHIIREDLNEWVALDVPGNYTLSVTSGRVTRRGESKQEPVELRSNTLDFEVVEATPGWQDQTLRSLEAVLNATGSTQEEKYAAIRALRFLDSPGSVRELVLRLAMPGDAGRWDLVAGLRASRLQEVVLRELEAQWSAPDAAITAEYLSLLAQAKFLLSHEPLPPYPQQNEEQLKSWKEHCDERMKQLNELQDELNQKTVSLLGFKRGAARAETVQTLVLRSANGSSVIKPLAGLPDSEIASAFLVLSPQRQASLLQNYWERLKVPAMVGALEKVLDQPQIQDQLLRNLAFQRLYNLDPSAVAARIRAEIQKPHIDMGMFTVSGKTLGVLPEKTLPEFDELLATRLEQKESRTRDLDAQLIGRYATPAILTRVKAVYEATPGISSCASANGLYSYFLRVDVDYGVKQMGQANSQCSAESIDTIVRIKRWAEVEPQVIKRLNDANVWAALSAAETLAKYGRANAERAIWERLRKFHQEWAEREKEFQFPPRPNIARDVSDASSFQYALVDSLGRAQGWLLDNDQITELESLTLGQARENVAQWHWHSPLDLNITLFDKRLGADINGRWMMNDLASLRAKLAQFPSGTRFRLNAYGLEQQLEPVLRAISETALDHGLVLETPVTP